jgi:hypothetical protein
MTGGNLTAMKLGPQAQRTEQASDLPGLGIPEVEAKRYEAKIKAAAGNLQHG